jgi:hypothetical protein
MGYQLVTGAYNFTELNAFSRCGIEGFIKHTAAYSSFHSYMEFNLFSAQKARTALIEHGADPLKIRIEYYQTEI